MKSFFKGVLAALVTVVLLALVFYEYRSYRSFMETSLWVYLLEPYQKAIEQNALQNNSLHGAAKSIERPDLGGQEGVHFIVTDDAVISIQGGTAGQAITLIPSLQEGTVEWRCIGGPAFAVPVACRDFQPLIIKTLESLPDAQKGADPDRKVPLDLR